MEGHRRRIESDHNEGLPESDWESMEEILDGFMRDYRDVRLCAMSYDVQYSEFAEWWYKRKGTGLTPAVYARANLKRDTIKKRNATP